MIKYIFYLAKTFSGKSDIVKSFKSPMDLSCLSEQLVCCQQPFSWNNATSILAYFTYFTMQCKAEFYSITKIYAHDDA